MRYIIYAINKKNVYQTLINFNNDLDEKKETLFKIINKKAFLKFELEHINFNKFPIKKMWSLEIDYIGEEKVLELLNKYFKDYLIVATF